MSFDWKGKSKVRWIVGIMAIVGKQEQEGSVPLKAPFLYQSRWRPSVLACRPSSAILATVSGIRISFLNLSCWRSSSARIVGPG